MKISRTLLLVLIVSSLYKKASADDPTPEVGKCPGNEDIYPTGAVLYPGLCAHIYLDTNDLVNELSRPRSLFVKDGQVFCLERGGEYEEWQNLTGYIVVYDDNDGIATGATVLANKTSLDHGLAVTDSHIYATNFEGVYRWPYTSGQREGLSDMEIVIKDIPFTYDQLHPTRTIIFDESDTMLYLAIGSEQNIDMDSSRANIRRYDLTNLPNGGLAWSDGEIVADGVRNTVGMGFDKFGVLWGVDNGADSAFRQDLGGDINEDNPADEVNKFPEMGRSYGFPFCFTEFILPNGVGMGTGTQWVWGNFTDQYTDDYCRDPSNNIPPQVALQAHAAPLGITFYEFKNVWPESCPDGVAFPQEWDGDAFITYHGSYYRDEPIGAKVMRIPMTPEGQVDGEIDLKPSVVMEDMDMGPEWLSGIRPVDVKFDECGRLLVSSDGSYFSQDGRMIILIQSTPPAPPPSSPTATPTATSGTSSSRGMIHAVVPILSLVVAWVFST